MNRVEKSYHAPLLANIPNKDYYNALASLVEKTICSPAHAAYWFSASSLRTQVFEYYKRLSPEYTECRIATKVFKACIYTAPLAMTLLAPQESYTSNAEHISGLALSYFLTENQVFSSRVNNTPLLSTESFERAIPQQGLQAGVDNLSLSLKKPIGANQGKLFFCCLFGSVHAFLIEKRGNSNHYLLYQSYLKEYSFLQFLQEEAKHKEWEHNELIEALRQILDTTNKKRWNCKGKRTYKKLFHVKRNAPINQRWTKSEGVLPLVFVSTEAYDLNWRQSHPEGWIYPSIQKPLSPSTTVSLPSCDENWKELAYHLHGLVFSKSSNWFDPRPALNANDIVSIYKPLRLKAAVVKESTKFKAFAADLFAYFFSYPVHIESLNEVSVTEAERLFELLPWPSMPEDSIPSLPRSHLQLLWQEFSLRASEGDLLDDKIAQNKAEKLACHMNHLSLIGRYMQIASPDLIEAVTPALLKTSHPSYVTREEIAKYLEQSLHPDRQHQLAAFNRSLT